MQARTLSPRAVAPWAPNARLPVLAVVYLRATQFWLRAFIYLMSCSAMRHGRRRPLGKSQSCLCCASIAQHTVRANEGRTRYVNDKRRCWVCCCMCQSTIVNEYSEAHDPGLWSCRAASTTNAAHMVLSVTSCLKAGYISQPVALNSNHQQHMDTIPPVTCAGMVSTPEQSAVFSVHSAWVHVPAAQTTCV